MAGHFDVTTVVNFVDNGTEVLLRGRDWNEEEMPKQSSSTIGEYLKYGAETKRKGVLKVTKTNPLSVRGDVVYPIGDVKKGRNVTIEYTSTYKTVRIDLIDVDAEATPKQAILPGTMKNPVLIDGNEEEPPQPALTPIATTAAATTADTPVAVPPPDAPISEHLRALEQEAFVTEARWTEARIENRSSWLATDALLNTAYNASEALATASEEARSARANTSQPNAQMPDDLQDLEQATSEAEGNWISSRHDSRLGWHKTDGLMDTAWKAYESLYYERDEIRVASENVEDAARIARSERGEAEESVADRRSRAREIATATQRGIDTRLRLYRESDQAAQEIMHGANENDRQTTTPPQRNAENNGANIGDVFGLSGPASRDMALLHRQEREGKPDGASELSEAVQNDDRYPNARKVAAVIQRRVENSSRLRRERDQAAQESIRRANDNLRQSTTPPQAEATTGRSEERARLGQARDQAQRNQTYEQRLLGKGTPEGRAYDRFVQEQNNIYSTSRAEAAAKFRRHVARKKVKGKECYNKKFMNMAKCPWCEKYASPRDKKALRRDIDNNSDSVLCYHPIHMPDLLYRCCGYVNASCLGCAMR
jgi:hypothetical protein